MSDIELMIQTCGFDCYTCLLIAWKKKIKIKPNHLYISSLTPSLKKETVE